MSSTSDYYKIQREHSRIKSEIVAAYLWPWAKIVGQFVQDLKYVDIFSGPGLFDDGNLSTPMLILEEVRKHEKLQNKLKITFYEGKRSLHQKLVANVSNHDAFDMLRHKPQFPEGKLDLVMLQAILSSLGKGTFTFIDPFGYKDISLDLLDLVSKDWGCDCLCYVSISGLERNILEEKQEPKVRSFFGDASYTKLRKALRNSIEEVSRSEIIMDEVSKVLQQNRKLFVAKYSVEFDKKRRPSHYLIFLSKDKVGFRIMCDIMIKRSLKDDHGFPLFLFSPMREQDLSQMSLDFGGPTDIQEQLATRLKSDFDSKTILVGDIYSKCLELGYEFQQAHVRKALNYLNTMGALSVIGTDGKLQVIKLLTKKHLVRFN